jgi:hypothetical protein
MLDEKARSEVMGIVRTSQIIVLTLVAGVTVFGGFVWQSRGAGQPAAGVLTPLALGAALVGIPLSLLLAQFVARSGVRSVAAGTWKTANPQGPAPATDAGRLAGVYQTKTIAGAAILEGVGFLTLFAYMQERQTTTLVAAGVLLGGLLCYCPTAGRLSDWVDRQLRRMKEEREFSPRP